MKLLFPLVGFAALALGVSPSSQEPSRIESCRFALSGEPTKPAVTGPEDIRSLVHVVDQPDSPIEIVAFDFKDSWFSVVHERVTEQLRCRVKLRNRSDQTINGAAVEVLVASHGGAGGSGANVGRLAPGQEVEVDGCGTHGSGGASDDYIRFLIFVRQVDMKDCYYEPSKRIPYELRVPPL